MLFFFQFIKHAVKHLIVKPFDLLNTISLIKTKTLVNHLLMDKSESKSNTEHLQYRNFKHKMERLQISQKRLYEKYYVHWQILRIRNCHGKFIKNLIPEKRKENMWTKQSRFKLWFKNRTNSISLNLYKELLKPNKSHTNCIIQIAPCKTAYLWQK